jgi:hypothetical protein
MRCAIALLGCLIGLYLGGCASVATSVAADVQLPADVRESPDRLILITVRNQPASLPSRVASTVRGYETANRYFVTPRARAIARSVAKAHGLREVVAWPITALRVYCVVFQVPGGVSRETVLARLAAHPDVELAQPMNSFAAAASAREYNDPFVDLQRGFLQMDVPAAHLLSRGAGVRVAIVDTGIDSRHPELAGRVIETRNFIDADRAQFERDRHGTEVAGLIAALAGNELGIVGVAPDVRILAYKSCWQLNAGTDSARCNSLTLAQGIAAAIDARAHVINLSVTGPTDRLLEQLVVAASNRGIVVVGAAASGGFPAQAPGVIAVDVAGAQRDKVPMPYFLAPGDDVFTLRPAGEYGFASGSSLAAAHVSGVVALLLARNAELGPDAIRRLLKVATKRYAMPGGEMESINACAALAAMLGEGSCQPSRLALSSTANP